MGYLLPIPYIQEENQYLRSKRLNLDPLVIQRISSVKLNNEDSHSKQTPSSFPTKDKKWADLTGKGLYIDEFV